MDMMLMTIFYWFMLIFLWYILGKCWIIYFENKLLGEKNLTQLWWVLKTKRYNKKLGEFISKLVIIGPVIWLIIALIRIKYICKNK